MPAWLVDFWVNWQPLIRVLAIAIAAVALRLMLLISVKRVVAGIVSGANGKSSNALKLRIESSPLAKERVVQRAQTMGSVLSNFITWGVAIIAVSMVLSELGVAVGALIAGAGILGAALGFGAQSLVRDLISGLFIVFEDQYGVGDTVDLGQATGVVESVGLRVTQIRDVSGTLWYVRNGEVLRVGNQSQGWSRVVLDVPLAYSVDTAKAQAAISTAMQKVAKDKNFKDVVIGAPEVWGLESLSGEQLVYRAIQQVKPAHGDEVARALRLEIKSQLDAAKIQLANSKQPIYLEVAGKAVK
jgi:small conductance mechanosensitive channel